MGIILIIFMVSVTFIVNNWMKEKRYKKRDATKEADHQAIVAIMSKNELLQSG